MYIHMYITYIYIYIYVPQPMAGGRRRLRPIRRLTCMYKLHIYILCVYNMLFSFLEADSATKLRPKEGNPTWP